MTCSKEKKTSRNVCDHFKIVGFHYHDYDGALYIGIDK